MAFSEDIHNAVTASVGASVWDHASFQRMWDKAAMHFPETPARSADFYAGILVGVWHLEQMLGLLLVTSQELDKAVDIILKKLLVDLKTSDLQN